MIGRPTRLTVAFMTLVTWTLFLGVLTGRAELLVVPAPFLVALVLARLAPLRRDYALTHRVSHERLMEGDRVTVTVTIKARSALRLLEVTESPAGLVAIVAGDRHALWSLAAGMEAQWTYDLEPRGRQRLQLGDVHVRIWDATGLRVLEARHSAPRTLPVYPRVLPLRRVPRPRATRAYAGHYVSRALGEGIEPGEIRPFAPGDRIRHVNWRATLRLGTLHVTQRHQERNADVVIMLDTLSAVGPAGDSSLDASVRAAASLASVYLARRDRVGLIEYGGLLRWVRPGSGRAHGVRLLDALVDAEVLFTYVAKDLALIPPRVLPPDALVIGVSPLLDSRFADAATNLAARGFDLLVLAVSPLEAARAAMRPSRALDLAARVWRLERAHVLDGLRRRGLTVVEWEPAQPLEAAMAAPGRARARTAVG